MEEIYILCGIHYHVGMEKAWKKAVSYEYGESMGKAVTWENGISVEHAISCENGKTWKKQ